MNPPDSMAWWLTVATMLTACIFDLRTRRIPNWLTVPYLALGLAFQGLAGGPGGFARGIEGAALAFALFAAPCFLRVMGMGDLKLIAGVGAWVGPNRLMLGLVVIGIVGGAIAVLYVLRGHRPRMAGAAGELRIAPPDQALSIPYAPAIAAGALFAFFAG